MSDAPAGEEVTSEQDSSLATEAPQEETAHVDNPEWQSIFDEFDNDPSMKFISDKIKDKLRPHLAKQDSAYQELSTKYSPYKDYVDNGVSPEVITQSLNAMRFMNENPKEFHERLSKYLGITVAEAKKLDEQAQEDSQDSDDEEVDPRLKGIQQKLDELAEKEQKREEDRQAQEWGRKIDADVSALQKVHESNPALRDIPYDFVKVQLMEIANQQIARMETLDIKKAYKEFETNATMIRSYANRGAQAPRVTPSGGGGTSLPLNTEPGTMPDDVARGSFQKRLEWAKRMGHVKS